MNKASKLIKKSIVFTKKSAIFAPASLLQDSIAQLVEHNTFNVGVLGSSPSRVTFFLLQVIITDLIAQLVEHNTFNVWVLGSSPSLVTSHKTNQFGLSFYFYFPFHVLFCFSPIPSINNLV